MKKNFLPPKLYRKIVEVIPVFCVDLVIKKKNKFLMVRRTEKPVQNQWWFPGGRVFKGERVESAVKRKLKEELNIKSTSRINFLRLGEMFFQKGRFGSFEHNIIGIFLVEVNKKDCSNIKPDKTISEYKWFSKIERNFSSYIKKFLKKANFN